MTKYLFTSRTGLAAIAAVLALPATSALAQDAATPPVGSIVLPDESVAVVPATPAPIVVPTAPVVIEEAAPAPARATAAPVAAERQPVATRQSVRPTAATTAPMVAQSVTPDIAVAPPAAALPVETAPVAEQVAPLAAASIPSERQSSDMTEALAQILAGLLVAGIGAGAIAMLLRRRRRSGETDSIVRREPIVAPVRTPVAYDTSRPAIEPAYGLAASTAGNAGGLPNQGAAIALPREAPTDFEERTSLLRRMVAARPDRANPFRSPAARLKRAKLIVASLGRKFENRAPRIDLSDYTSNWPALARRRTAYA